MVLARRDRDPRPNRAVSECRRTRLLLHVLSLVALQIVFELGFSVVILQTATHEAAHLTLAEDGMVSGPDAAHARLASVLQKSVRWYTIAAVLMAAILLPAGMFFFSRQTAAHPSSHAVSWMMPWILIVVATTFTFQIDPIFSFLEGCGYVSQVARTRLWQAILGTSMGGLRCYCTTDCWPRDLLFSGRQFRVAILSMENVVCCDLFSDIRQVSIAFPGEWKCGRSNGGLPSAGCVATLSFKYSIRFFLRTEVLSKPGKWGCR